MDTNHTYNLKVPKAFFLDHCKRACLIETATNRCMERHEVIVKETASHYFIQLDAEQGKELLSDADHYSTEWKYMGTEFLGLGRSALATKKAVCAQMIEQGYVFDELTIKRYRLATMVAQ